MSRGVSLARALSKLGAASRSAARGLIADGHVVVDDVVVRDPARRVDLATARIQIDGARAVRTAPRLILFNKPRGVVTTRRDPEGRQTVFDVLGAAGDGLIAVGRLDRASTGLLILTNDTQLAHQLTDPASRLVRRYVVTVRGRLDDEQARQIERGMAVAMDDGQRETLRASRVTIRKASGRETHLIVELKEGRNREIRRLFGALGREVTRVHRIAFGPYELGDLEPGEWRLQSSSLPWRRSQRSASRHQAHTPSTSRQKRRE